MQQCTGGFRLQFLAPHAPRTSPPKHKWCDPSTFEIYIRMHAYFFSLSTTGEPKSCSDINKNPSIVDVMWVEQWTRKSTIPSSALLNNPHSQQWIANYDPANEIAFLERTIKQPADPEKVKTDPRSPILNHSMERQFQWGIDSCSSTLIKSIGWSKGTWSWQSAANMIESTRPEKRISILAWLPLPTGICCLLLHGIGMESRFMQYKIPAGLSSLIAVVAWQGFFFLRAIAYIQSTNESQSFVFIFVTWTTAMEYECRLVI